MKLKDISGYEFGNGCIVIKFDSMKNKASKWTCKCHCGNIFSAFKGNIKRKNGIQECKPCSIITRSKKREKDYTGLIFGNNNKVLKKIDKNKYGHTMYLILCSCGNKFKLSTSHITRNQKTCLQCRFDKMIDDLTGQKINNWKVIEQIDFRGIKSCTYYLCECDCGNITSVARPVLTNSNTNFCSKCYIGENTVLWKKELSDYDRKNRNRRLYPGYLQFLRIIYKRDNYKCFICSNSDNINCHHLNSWHNHENERLSYNNCITLCELCHKKFHSVFGYGSNTKEQFHEFVRMVYV